MGALYDRADIYDLIETEERFSVYRQHWEGWTWEPCWT